MVYSPQDHRVRHTTQQLTLSLLLSSRVQHDQILAFNYHILRHRYEIQKDGTDEPICSAPVETKTWRTDRWTQPEWEEGEGGRYGESNTQTYLPYVKQIANGNLLYDSGNSLWGSVTAQRGEMVREEGGTFRWERTWVNLWLIHVDVWQKPMQYCKAIIFQVKISKLKKIIFKKNCLLQVVWKMLP